jgi:3-oxoacyl-[acyl-carrier protein] reductase
MLLRNVNAIVYGAGGSLGGAVAKALAMEGARVFATGRTLEPVQAVADQIRAAGGQGEASALDALDARAVADFVSATATAAGGVGISFSAIGLQDLQGVPLTDMKVDDFVRPIRIAMESQFITCTAAARIMKAQRAGVILTLTATPGGIGYPLVGGFGPACCAIEGLSRNLASEVGPFGVRVVNIRSAGSPDSRVFQEAMAEGGDTAHEFMQKIVDDTMLKGLPSMADIANAAVFLSSPGAAKITGVTIDVTCGSTAALNYKTPTAFFNP